MKLVTSARQAYWRRDVEQAEKDYRALIDLQADSPDPYGELGNVYYSAGKWQEAAEAYFQSGERLIKQGQYGRVMHLISVLRGLNTERANALEAELNKAWPQQADDVTQQEKP